MAARKTKKMMGNPKSEQREITEFERRYLYGGESHPELRPESQSQPRSQPQSRSHPQPQSQHQSSKSKNKIRFNRYVLLILFLLFLAGAEYSAYRLINRYEVLGDNDISKYENILSEAEKQEWQTKKAVPQEVFIQINTKIDVSEDNKANLRLINPPYSRYRYHVRLALLDPERTVYQDDIDPGTVYTFVDLNQTLAPGDYKGVVYYEFLNSKGKVVGTHQVEVTLSTKEEKEESE